MRSSLSARIERLEGATRRALPALLQYGWVRKLHGAQGGDRRVAIVKRLRVRDGLEWVEAEEVIDRS